MEEEENRALQTINKTLAKKAAKRIKLNKEVEDLKRHLEIVPDEDDDVYTEATPLAKKVPVVDYEIIEINNKPCYKIIRADGTHQLYISFLTLLKNFDREDLENRVLVTKPHNKTPYELLHSRTPSIGFMRYFGYHMTILNTLDSLGKFERKVDEGFLVGYSANSKAFRVFNSRTQIVQETLHVNFLENKPNIIGSGPTWLFDVDILIRTMNYQPVIAGNQTNLVQNYDGNDAFDGKEHDFDAKKPESEVILSLRNSAQSRKQGDKTKKEAKGKSPVESFTRYRYLSSNSNNPFSAVGPSNTTASLTHGKSSFIDASQLFDDPDMPKLKDITYSDDENDEEHKRVHQALKDPSWIEAMQEELLQFKMQKVWVFVDLPHGKRAIGTKWVYKNKKDERGIVVRNKTRLVAHEEGIDYEEVFALIYVDNIIFGATNKDLCKSFEKLMKDKFQMSSVGELTLFLGLQKPLLKDLDGEDVDVHTYRSMIGSLMYLTSSGPDIMFAVNDVTRLQALVDKKKVVVREAAITKVLRLDDAEGVDCLPNDEIFIGKGFSRVETPLLEEMLIGQEIEEEGDADEHVEDVTAGDDAKEMILLLVEKFLLLLKNHPYHLLPQLFHHHNHLKISLQHLSLLQEALDACVALAKRVEHLEYDKVAQALEITKFKRRVKKLKKGNKARVLKLRWLQKVGTSQRVDTSDDTMMDDKSKQGRMIDEMDKDDAIILMDENEIVTATSLIIYAAEPQVPAATITTTPTKVPAAPSRRRKGVVIRDPEEESTTSSIISTKTKSKDKGKGIMVEEPKPLKKKQHIEMNEEYARKLHAELNEDIY
nr:putative ribonuclease H-like domain-containing protein [Tanacetum cinerariifolium]